MWRMGRRGVLVFAVLSAGAVTACDAAGQSVASQPETAKVAAWSEVVNGLQARIIYVGEGGYDGYTVLLRLRNGSQKPLQVPLRLGELMVDGAASGWRSVDEFVIGGLAFPASAPSEGDANGAVLDAVPSIRLFPGQEAVLDLQGTAGPLTQRASKLKAILRREDATLPPEAWQGVLETPAVGAHWPGKMLDCLKGTESFPAFFPHISAYTGGNFLSGRESRVWHLQESNRQLLAALPLFEPPGVRKEFERRLAAAKDPHMQLLVASVAAEAGSDTAVAYLRAAMRQTDYSIVMSLHSALKRLIHRHGEQQPAWLMEMVHAAVSDRRSVTGLEKTNFSEDTTFTVAWLAAEVGDLTLALGYVKSRQATLLLLERVRQSPERSDISALGELGDPRAVPVLIDVLKSSGKQAKHNGGYGLSPEIFERSVAALGKLKAADAVPVLLEYTEYPEVIEAIGLIGDRRAVPALRELIKANGDLTRNGEAMYPMLAAKRLAKARIALALSEEGDPVPRLCALLGDKSLGEFERLKVVWRLGDQPDSRAVPHLIEAIRSDPSGAVVYHAITVLSVYRYKTPVEGLIGCFDANFTGKTAFRLAYDPGMFHGKVADSLRTITGQSFGADKDRWLTWWKSEGHAVADLK